MESPVPSSFLRRHGEDLVRVLTAPLGEYAADLHRGLALAAVEVIKALGTAMASADTAKNFLAKAGRIPEPTGTTGHLVQAIATGADLATLLEAGTAFSALLFGPGEQAAIDRIAGQAGLRTSSAAWLSRVVSQCVWADLHAQAGGRPGRREINEFLDRELPLPPTKQPAVPAGGNNLPLMDTNNPTPEQPREPSSRSRKFLPWVLLILASLAALILLQRGCGITPRAGNKEESGGKRELGAGQSFGNTGNTIEEGDPWSTFPTGFEVLVSSSGMPTPTHCFILDQLAFREGSAQILPSSEPQLDTLLAIMNKYPNVVLGLEGHSGLSEDETRNEVYAQQKVDAVKDWLVVRGLPEGRVLVTTWGSRNPRYKEGTETDRQRNERVEACVVSK